MNGVLDVTVRRHHDDRSLFIHKLDLPQKINAVHARQAQIDECQIENVFPECLKRRRAVCGRDDRVSLFLQVLLQKAPISTLVFDHQNFLFAHNSRRYEMLLPLVQLFARDMPCLGQ